LRKIADRGRQALHRAALQHHARSRDRHRQKSTDAQIKLAIREGRRPDGTLIGPPMPFSQYSGIADSDLDAVVAYLRSVPAEEKATTPAA